MLLLVFPLWLSGSGVYWQLQKSSPYSCDRVKFPLYKTYLYDKYVVFVINFMIDQRAAKQTIRSKSYLGGWECLLFGTVTYENVNSVHPEKRRGNTTKRVEKGFIQPSNSSKLHGEPFHTNEEAIFHFFSCNQRCTPVSFFCLFFYKNVVKFGWA